MCRCNKTVTFIYTKVLWRSDEMSNETSTDLVKQVEEYIHTEEQVSIQDVAKQFNISRYRTNGILGMLVGAGKVGVKEIGPVKVHYWRR